MRRGGSPTHIAFISGRRKRKGGGSVILANVPLYDELGRPRKEGKVCGSVPRREGEGGGGLFHRSRRHLPCLVKREKREKRGRGLSFLTPFLKGGGQGGDAPGRRKCARIF